jgi:hypothetical protein
VGLDPWVSSEERACHVGPNSTAFAMVAQADQARTDELKERLEGLVSDPDLHLLWKKGKEAQENASVASETYAPLVRELGRKLDHGEPLKGTCGLGY